MGVHIKVKYLTEDRRPQNPGSMSLRPSVKFVTQEKEFDLGIILRSRTIIYLWQVTGLINYKYTWLKFIRVCEKELIF
jgi:hypothetical protein